MRNTQATKLLSELSQPGRRATRFPACESSRETTDLLPASALAENPPPLPELAEPDVVRHYTNLSTLNMSVDTHFYPLGSCTMKHNPKRNERVASLPGLLNLHPYQRQEDLQGLLQLLFELQELLAEISGLPACSLQPAAGAHGELTALMCAAAYFRQREDHRTKVLTPDSAHGTNPASAVMCGFEAVTIKSGANGRVDMDDLRSKLDEQTAVLMITNPNTLGLFEHDIAEICATVHKVGGLVYLDGANMNAILGIARPGDFGADMMHFNPHKTFSGPHGGGGPGAGPICVTEALREFLPAPVVVAENDSFRLADAGPHCIGRVRSFFGNTGVLVRAYAYIRTHGPEGLRAVSEQAVLNANYLLSRIKHFMPAPHGDRCMHEFIVSAGSLKKEQGITAMDLAKRLLDFGFHAPTVYFPLTVAEAMMMEPTETESKQTLDAFAAALFQITGESSEMLHEAPHSTAISRADEVTAARKPTIRCCD